MLGVVFASPDEPAASVVAAESWTRSTGGRVAVLARHPDLVRPLQGMHPDAHVRSWAQASTPPGADGALLAATVSELGADDVVVLLPRRALVLGPPTSLVDAAREHGVALIARGEGAPVGDDDLRPTAADVGRRGALHDELVGLRARDDRATAFLQWWDTVAGEDRAGLLSSPARGAVVVADAGTGVGWWNLHERPLARDGERLTAGGAPVSIVDLDGWSPQHPHMLHPDMTRLLGSADPALRWLVERYATHWSVPDVPAEGLSVWPEDPQLAELLDQAPAGLRTPALRDDPGARDAFLEWAADTDPEDTVWGINRYLLSLRRRRHDLRIAFPDLQDRDDALRFVEWARRDGPAAGVPERYLGRVPVLEQVPAPDGRSAARRDGVNLIGIFGEPALGIAEIARQVRRGLEGAGTPVASVSVDRRGRPDPTEGDAPLPYDVTVACVNADLLPVVARRLARRLPPAGALVGVWWWELEEVPASWDAAIELVDEIWAGTGFVARAFEAHTDVPVRRVPLGLATPPEVTALRSLVGRDPRPYVLVTFDHASRIQRKNPVGAIEAFRRADLGPDVRLVVKSVNGDLWPREAERVRLAAVDAGSDRVQVLDARLPAGEQAALVAGAAAHLALHRSEGLGLTIVEAMMQGVPVVATDYGGSTDLLHDGTGWPVPWTPGVVPPGCSPYPAGAAWAEPDLDAAASALGVVLSGGPDVEARVAAGRSAADARARRIAEGIDIVAAVRQVASRRRGRPVAAGPGRSARSIVRRLRG